MQGKTFRSWRSQKLLVVWLKELLAIATALLGLHFSDHHLTIVNECLDSP